jgi:hypothetical protein
MSPVSCSKFKGSPTICTVYGAETATCTWSTKKLDAGMYTIEAQALDRIGNRGQASITVELLKAAKGGGGKGKGNGGA